jgi:hypothetical protein
VEHDVVISCINHEFEDQAFDSHGVKARKEANDAEGFGFYGLPFLLRQLQALVSCNSSNGNHGDIVRKLVYSTETAPKDITCFDTFGVHVINRHNALIVGERDHGLQSPQARHHGNAVAQLSSKLPEILRRDSGHLRCSCQRRLRTTRGHPAHYRDGRLRTRLWGCSDLVLSSNF